MPKKDLKRPLLEHLDEIRERVLVVLAVFIVLSAVSFYFVEDVLRWLKTPGGSYLGALSVFSPTAAILAFFKMSFFFGLILSLPVLLYELWMFIRPAVKESLAWCGALIVVLGTGLFIAGALLSFYFLVPASLKFLLSIGRGDLQFLISLDSYVSFILLFMAMGGLILEMPLLAFFLAKLNILTAATMLRCWRTAVVGAVILSALVTPTPDAFNMVLMTMPILILYMISIGIVKLTQARNKEAL